MAVVRKFRKVLEDRFPRSDKVAFRDDYEIIGVVTSKRFRRMDTMARQNLIHDILANHLTGEERRQILLIVGVTLEKEVIHAEDQDE